MIAKQSGNRRDILLYVRDSQNFGGQAEGSPYTTHFYEILPFIRSAVQSLRAVDSWGEVCSSKSEFCSYSSKSKIKDYAALHLQQQQRFFIMQQQQQQI